MRSADQQVVSKRELETEITRLEGHISQLRIELASAVGFLASSTHPVIGKEEAERFAVLFGEISQDEANQGVKKVARYVDALKERS